MDNTTKTGEGQESTDNYQLSIASCPLTVSYTHLTLPTIA